MDRTRCLGCSVPSGTRRRYTAEDLGGAIASLAIENLVVTEDDIREVLAVLNGEVPQGTYLHVLEEMGVFRYERGPASSGNSSRSLEGEAIFRRYLEGALTGTALTAAILEASGVSVAHTESSCGIKGVC